MFSFTPSCELSIMVTLILQTGKQRPEDSGFLAQGHRASQVQSWDLTQVNRLPQLSAMNHQVTQLGVCEAKTTAQCHQYFPSSQCATV
jgi:hypothetical protein